MLRVDGFAKKIFFGADGINQIALVLVGLADPQMSPVAPGGLVDVEQQQRGGAVAKEGFPQVLVKLEMILGAIPNLYFEIVYLGLDAVHVHFVLFSGAHRFEELADQPIDETGLSTPRISDDADLQLDDFLPRNHMVLINEQSLWEF
jgi:hypothetical protein